MIKKDFSVSETAFDELCKYVCHQLEPSGSKELDRETLSFAIYWQICTVLGVQMNLSSKFNCKTTSCQWHLQNLIDCQTNDSFDALNIINKNINEGINKQYLRRTLSSGDNVYNTDYIFDNFDEIVI